MTPSGGGLPGGGLFLMAAKHHIGSHPAESDHAQFHMIPFDQFRSSSNSKASADPMTSSHRRDIYVVIFDALG
jgi:hypothetical protein